MESDGTSREQRDGETVQVGMRFGYGHWLRPIIDSNGLDQSSPEPPTSDPIVPSTPRRGRGRPRVTKPRDESAIERRRAQVREAQRTYQKRKDNAAATERRRCDDLLQVISDLSSDVELLLQAASKAGILEQNDEVATHVRRLWSSYDTAINSACLKPELRLLAIKNDRRRAEYKSNDNFRIGVICEDERQEPSGPTTWEENTDSEDPENFSLDLVRGDETTVGQSFRSIETQSRVMGGRSIFDVVKERQAAFNNSQRSLS